MFKNFIKYTTDAHTQRLQDYDWISENSQILESGSILQYLTCMFNVANWTKYQLNSQVYHTEQIYCEKIVGCEFNL